MAKSSETATTAEPVTEAGSTGEAKARFARAVEEAKAGVQALGKEAQGKAGAYKEKIAGAGTEFADEAKAKGAQAKDVAADLATQGKAKASEAMSALGTLVADNAAVIDEKVGAKYGDYARSAARSMQDAAAKLDAKDINELGEDAKEFVRKSPGLAVGMAAAAGFLIARLFRGSGK